MQGVTAAAADHLVDNAAAAAVDAAESSVACFRDQFGDEGVAQYGFLAAVELASGQRACYQNAVGDESVVAVSPVCHAHTAGSQLAEPADVSESLADRPCMLGCQHTRLHRRASVGGTSMPFLGRPARSTQTQQVSCRASHTVLHELQRPPSPEGKPLPSQAQESSSGIG